LFSTALTIREGFVSRIVLLTTVEHRCIECGVLQMRPHEEPKAAKAQLEIFRDYSEKLVGAFALNDLSAGEMLRTRNLLATRLPGMAPWNVLRLCMKAVIEERAGFLAKSPEAIPTLLPQLVKAATHHAAVHRFNSEFHEFVHLAAYCTAVIDGPIDYDLPEETPVGVELGLPYVPSLVDARRQRR
jgi:hypothetical protein